MVSVATLPRQPTNRIAPISPKLPQIGAVQRFLLYGLDAVTPDSSTSEILWIQAVSPRETGGYVASPAGQGRGWVQNVHAACALRV